MTINELIKQLERHSPNDKIYVSSDAEGNNIHELDGVYILETETHNDIKVIYPSDSYLDL